MADDNILRSYRSSEASRRASAPAASKDAGGSDPLAELARLIGQSDPYVELERNARHSTEAGQRADSASSDWRKTAAALARESMREPPPADPRFEQLDSAIAAPKSLRVSRDEPLAHPGSQSSQWSQSSHDADFDQATVPQGGYADSPYDDRMQADHRLRADDHVDDRLHDSLQVGAQDSEDYFFDGAAAPTDDRFYDDPPRARTTNGLVTAIVLVGCGMLGTVGAYGYRTYYLGARPTDAPIISAEKSPNKMVPVPAGGDSQSGGKSIQERVGASSERVVARQEEPVTLSDASATSGPRVVLPAPFTPSPGPGPAVVQSNPTPMGAATEPKKVRTVAIRPDGSDPMARPVSAGSPPLQVAPPVATTRQPPTAKPASAPPRNGGGPLLLDPQGQTSETVSSYQQAPRERPTPAPASAPRLASVSPTVPGGYLVQISSQRNEADAQASFRSLQSKFPKELGDREAIVRRADLGPKGVYYRAMVGPFGSAGDADQFCSGLKAAGGQCIVQKN